MSGNTGFNFFARYKEGIIDGMISFIFEAQLKLCTEFYYGFPHSLLIMRCCAEIDSDHCVKSSCYFASWSCTDFIQHQISLYNTSFFTDPH
jgi:hypothetical protein